MTEPTFTQSPYAVPTFIAAPALLTNATSRATQLSLVNLREEAAAIRKRQIVGGGKTS
jgi:hypothetical protein